MEILFENRYVQAEDWAKECYRYAQLFSPMLISLLAFVVLGSLGGLVNYFVFSTVDFMFFVLPLLLLLFGVVYFKASAGLVLKRNAEYGIIVEVVSVITQEAIQISSSDKSQIQLRYENIRGVVQTKHFILLRSKANVFYALKTDAFSIGCAEDFLAFLKSKGLKVR